MFWFVCQMAVANTWGPSLGDFLSPPREDAPVDGMLVFYANYPVDAVLTYEGNTVVLPTEELVSDHYARFSSMSQRAIYAPEGGWPVGVPLEVTVSHTEAYAANYNNLSYTLMFSSDGHLAGDPAVLTSLVGDVTAWNLTESTPWGCCDDVRSVEMSVQLAQPLDSWAGVLVSPLFAPQSTTLSYGLGSAFSFGVGGDAYEHTVVQWVDHEALQPECYLVQSLSESGELGVGNSLCVTIEPGDPPAQGFLGEVVVDSVDVWKPSTDPTPGSTDPTPGSDTGSAEQPSGSAQSENSGCSTTNAPLGGLSLWLLLPLLGYRRRSAP